MANSNAPSGLLPINQNSGDWTGQGRLIYIPASQATSIFLGDPLVPLGGGDALGVPAYGLATAGATNYVAGGYMGNANGPAGSQFTLLRDSPVYHLGGVAGYGFIADDPNQVFVIQEDSVGGAIAAATGGMANGNLVAGAGSTVTGFSGWQLQSSSVAAGNPTFQLRLLGLVRGPDNALGVNAKWAVRINLAALWDPTGF